ncbi:MAG TPA: TagF domain-containing protein, partial [Thermoanaerobaculia bacterium]|nr:TagF domain-containing protein [Thermoanaerobaculia bacterium]
MPDSFPPERPGLLRRLWGGGPEKTKTFRLSVNAYGKLPIYKDFISSGLTEPAAREFRAWLDKGFSHRWATDDGCRESEIPPYNFLVRLPDSRGCAAGSLWGSSDEGGLRKFPFALFLSFPGAHGAADPIAAVEYLGDLERRASELRFLFGPGASLSSFYQAYRGAELDVPVRSREQVAREFRSELAGFSIGDFAESILGSRAPRAWPQLLAATAAASERGGALRLPLGGRLPRAREVEFWLLWLERQDAKRRRPVTGVFYPHGHNPGRAVFFFRDVVPDDFLLFHPTRTDLPQIYEALAHVPATTEAPVPPPRRSEGARPAGAESVP